MFKYKYVWPYVLVGLTVILVLAANGIYLNQHLEINKTYAGIINEAGRQSMLSQKLALLSYERYNGKDVQAQQYRELEKFNTEYTHLQGLRDEMYTPAITSSFQKLAPVQQRLYSYYLQASSTKPDAALLSQISATSDLFQLQMDGIVNAFEANAQKDLHGINKTQQWMAYASVFIIFLVISFFIYPYHKKLVLAYRELKQTKTEVDKLHTGAVLSIEGIQAGIWDWNIETGTQVWSGKFYELLGYEQGEIKASRDMFINVLLHPDDKPRVLKAVNEHLEHGTPYKSEVRIKNKFGTYKWFEVAGKANRNEQGVPVRMCGSVIDINDQINYRTQLEYNEFLLQEVGGMAKVGGWEFDVQTETSVWTRTMYDIHETHINDTERITRRFENYPVKYHERIKQSMHMAITQGEPFDMELEMITAKGDLKWIRSLGTPLFDKNGQVVKLRGVYQDIDLGKKKELELMALKQAMQIANRTKDKLFSIISHDLRSPLNTLHSLLTLKEEDLIDEKEFRKYMLELKSITGNISFTMENLLQWSVTQMQGFKVTTREVKVYNIAEEVINLYKGAIKAKYITIHNYCDAAHFVNADADHVNLVVRNLVSNAVKFTPNYGSIIIRTELNDNEVEISVSDTGVGMDAADIENINNVEVLYSTQGTNGEKGLGLGLNFCKDMAVLNGGNIAVASEKGKGTQMKLILPATTGVSSRKEGVQDANKEKSQVA